MHKWQSASNYLGEEYPEYYVAMVKTRDSEALDRSNFDATLKMLGGESETIKVIRSGHWGAGWIDTILIHESDKIALAIGEDIGKQLASYPVLDEDLYSQYESKEVEENWQYFSLAEKRDMLSTAKLPRSLATRKRFPYKYDNGSLYEAFTNH